MPATNLTIDIVQQTVGSIVVVELSDKLDGLLEPLAGLTFVYDNERAEGQPEHRSDLNLVVVNEKGDRRRIDVSQYPDTKSWLNGFLAAARELRA